MSQSAKATSCRWRWTRHCAARSLASGAMHFVHLQEPVVENANTSHATSLTSPCAFVTATGLRAHGVLLGENVVHPPCRRRWIRHCASRSLASALCCDMAFFSMSPPVESSVSQSTRCRSLNSGKLPTNAAQEPVIEKHCPWSITGVSDPFVVQFTASGSSTYS